MSTLNRANAVALSVTALSKSYPGVKALNDVTLTVRRGQVLAVVGENGAGKSTLMKLIAGAVRPSIGAIEVFDTPVLGGNPRSAQDAGVAMIYQELTIVPEMSAEENVFLGHMPSRWAIMHFRELRRRYRAVGERVGAAIPPRVRAGALSTANQQLLEIMRAIAHGRQLVIMDEPTASLGPEEISRLHAIIRDLRSEGCAVLYVSHDLDAVLNVSDEVLVMREGSVVAHAPTASWSKSALVKAMLGHLPDAPARAEVGKRDTPTVVQLTGVVAPGVNIPDLAIRAGEVVGIAGLVGSGRTRMLRSIAGADAVKAGVLILDGKEVPWPTNPAKAWWLGIALSPEDRKHQGLMLDRESSWNIALGGFGLARRYGSITRRSIRSWAKPIAQRVAFRPERLGAVAGTLSGGNQQKLLLGRLLSRPLRLMLLDEPTRGMDIGAKAEVFGSMRKFAESGRAVLWSSSEIQEVLDNSDRVIVVRSGRVVSELLAGSTVHDVLISSFAASEVDAPSSPASQLTQFQEK